MRPPKLWPTRVTSFGPIIFSVACTSADEIAAAVLWPETAVAHAAKIDGNDAIVFARTTARQNPTSARGRESRAATARRGHSTARPTPGSASRDRRFLGARSARVRQSFAAPSRRRRALGLLQSSNGILPAPIRALNIMPAARRSGRIEVDLFLEIAMLKSVPAADAAARFPRKSGRFALTWRPPIGWSRTSIGMTWSSPTSPRGCPDPSIIS